MSSRDKDRHVITRADSYHAFDAPTGRLAE